MKDCNPKCNPPLDLQSKALRLCGDLAEQYHDGRTGRRYIPPEQLAKILRMINHLLLIDATYEAQAAAVTPCVTRHGQEVA